MKAKLKLARIALLGASFLLLVVGVGYCARSASQKSQVKAKLERIRADGFPVTLAELNDWYEEPPPSQNAAEVYGVAFANMAAVPSTAPSFLAQNQRALEGLHQGAKLEKSRYPVDFKDFSGSAEPFSSLEHLSKLKLGVQLLSQEAVARVAQGRLDLATDSLVDGLRLARSLEQEPVLLSHLVQVASEKIMYRGLESVLNRRSLPAAQLAKLQAAFRDAETGHTLRQALAGERCLAISIFQSPAPLKSLMESAGSGPESSGADSFSNLGLQAYTKTPKFTEDFIYYLDMMAETIDECSKPGPLPVAQLVDRLRSGVAEARQRGLNFSFMLFGGVYPLAVLQSTEGVAVLRVAQTVLAIERFRGRHNNELPASLSQLIPEYLEAAPTDPFDGQALRYVQLQPRGYMVYSIGRDFVDNHGAATAAGANPDLVCSVAH